MQYYGIILCFIGGAAVGAFVTELLETKAVFVALTGLVIALCILRSDDDKLAEGSDNHRVKPCQGLRQRLNMRKPDSKIRKSKKQSSV